MDEGLRLALLELRAALAETRVCLVELRRDTATGFDRLDALVAEQRD
jgi:hypothetical protein